MSQSQSNTVAKLYKSVIEDVILSSKEIFLDEGIDEQVLTELKNLWEQKLAQSKAVEEPPIVPDPVIGSGLPSDGDGLSNGSQGAATAAASSSSHLVAVQINIPMQSGVPNSPMRHITIHVPHTSLTCGAAQLQAVLSSSAAMAAMALPPDVAARLLQQQVNSALGVGQSGTGGSSGSGGGGGGIAVQNATEDDWLQNASFPINFFKSQEASGERRPDEETLENRKDSSLKDRKRPQQYQKQVFLEDTSLKPENAFRVDPKPDGTARAFPAMYHMHVPRYKLNGFLSWDCLEGNNRWHRKKEKKLPRYFNKVGRAAINRKDVEHIFLSLPPFRSNFTSWDVKLEEFMPLYYQHAEMNSQAAEEEMSSHMQKAKELNQSIGQDVRNIDKWLELLNHQDELSLKEFGLENVTVSIKGKPQQSALVERKLSIVEAALKKNPASIQLHIKKLQLCRFLWEPAKLKKEWGRISFLFPNSIKMWKEYLLFTQSHLPTFSVISTIKTYERFFEKMRAFHAGTILSHSKPDHLEEHMLEHEDEEERIAMEENMSSPQKWLAIETLREKHHWLPWKPGVEDECEDADRTASFEDVSPFLFDLKKDSSRFGLLLHFLTFLDAFVLPKTSSSHLALGLESPHLFSTLQIQLCLAASCSGAHGLSASLGIDGKCDHPRSQSFTQFRDRVFLSSIDLCSEDQKMAVLIQYMAFRLAEFQMCQFSSLQEQKNGAKELRKFAKNLLKSANDRNNLDLYRAYASMEEACGNVQEASRILETTLASIDGSRYTTTVLSLDYAMILNVLWHWITLKMKAHNHERVLWVLASMGGGLGITLGQEKETTPSSLILKARRRFPEEWKKLVIDSHSVLGEGHVFLAIVPGLSHASDVLLTWSACHALFQYLTMGSIQAGSLIFSHALSELKCSNANQEEEKFKPGILRQCMMREMLHWAHMNLLEWHRQRQVYPLQPVKAALVQAMSDFPNNPSFLKLFIDIQMGSFLISNIRDYFGKSLKHCYSIWPPHFSVWAEKCRLQKVMETCSNQDSPSGEVPCFGVWNHMVATLEELLHGPPCSQSPYLWRLYLRILYDSGKVAALKSESFVLQDIYLDGVRYDGSLLEEVCNLVNEKGLRLRLPLEELQVLSEPLPQSDDEDHATVKSEPREELDDSSSSEEPTSPIEDKEQVHSKQNEMPSKGDPAMSCNPQLQAWEKALLDYVKRRSGREGKLHYTEEYKSKGYMEPTVSSSAKHFTSSGDLKDKTLKKEEERTTKSRTQVKGRMVAERTMPQWDPNVLQADDTFQELFQVCERMEKKVSLRGNKRLQDLVKELKSEVQNSTRSKAADSRKNSGVKVDQYIEKYLEEVTAPLALDDDDTISHLLETVTALERQNVQLGDELIKKERDRVSFEEETRATLENLLKVLDAFPVMAYESKHFFSGNSSLKNQDGTQSKGKGDEDKSDSEVGKVSYVGAGKGDLKLNDLRSPKEILAATLTNFRSALDASVPFSSPTKSYVTSISGPKSPEDTFHISSSTSIPDEDFENFEVEFKRKIQEHDEYLKKLNEELDSSPL
ncbi:unnamed protein product [Darwinula stevensoni]|uniref:Uncharacterized protein n=1 Tax=Darwinula stevensoni TaxID=69355 RepID=A0A7R8X8F1_9CRUS|nr:unnamed protein product [Darwinula stevensoni]CAG0883288.1 unnamed protein product [Darwinula stevensoni]